MQTVSQFKPRPKTLWELVKEKFFPKKNPPKFIRQIKKG